VVAARIEASKNNPNWGLLWVDGATAFAGLDAQGLLLNGYEPSVSWNSLGSRSVPSDKSYIPAGVYLAGARPAPRSPPERPGYAGAMDGSEDTAARVRAIATDIFGLTALRPAQEDATAALAAGRDCLAILPSGSGKSAIYEIAAIALGGPAIVVSPLLALQRDQARALRERGQTVVTVNAQSGPAARAQAEELLGAGRPGFVFLAPEQFARDDVRTAAARAPVALFAVDEAHCIASWGHDFRPDYLRLGSVIDAFARRPAVAAVTATAAPPVRQEIIGRLGLREPRQVIRDFDRPEIHLAVRVFHRAADQHAAVLAAVREQDGTGLVYTATRKAAEGYAAELGVPCYHGGLGAADRRAAQRAFEQGGTIVATNAFGMGIDRSDVRFVVHAAVSGSVDEYYQEIGRAGRDGKPATAICCYRAQDLGIRRFFASGLPDEDELTAVASAADRPLARGELAERTGMARQRLGDLLNLLEAAGAVRLGRRIEPAADAPPPERAAAAAVELARQHRSAERSRVEMMRRYAEMPDCRRRFMLQYFGEKATRACRNCDNCDAGRCTPAATLGPFLPGEHVEHPEWGQGLVLGGEDNRLIVLFDDYGYRELSAEVVARRHLLKRDNAPGD
jgi:ATP-dependent DNA helicase RecQ